MQSILIQQLILGVIQGITEWLPISSSAMTTLIMTNFFNITDISILIHQALFLHLGTFFAALIYFRKDVRHLLKSLFHSHKKSKKPRPSPETKKPLRFLIITTIISGILGLVIMKFISSIDLELTGKTITFVIGLLLFVTGGLQLSVRKKGLRRLINIENSDSIFLGFTQGLAALPGISRSGITVSTLLLRKFNDTTALRLSFLMSLPIVLLGNIFLNLPDIATTFTYTSLIGLLASFAFGLATIHALMKLSKKINFGWFVLIFAMLMMLSVLI
ncbi:UDP-diphosphatase [Candidatus Pacearchaeota archaeon]|nr:UDP-diphosphatase [Candidatus Pacearchaeota archaeon]